MSTRNTLTRIHCGLRRRPDGDGLLEIRASAVYGAIRQSQLVRTTVNARSGDPGNFGGEALDVVLLTFQHLLRNKHGKVGVLDTELPDVNVEPIWSRQSSAWVDLPREHTLYDLPDAVRPWFQDVAATNAVVVDHVRLREDLYAIISGRLMTKC